MGRGKSRAECSNVNFPLAVTMTGGDLCLASGVVKQDAPIAVFCVMQWFHCWQAVADSKGRYAAVWYGRQVIAIILRIRHRAAWAPAGAGMNADYSG